MRIAIVGAGVSGLLCAHLLSREHQVTVFESATYLGGHTNTVEVDVEGDRQSVDTGFIVFNDNYYPNFRKLIDRLSVASQWAPMSLSVRCDETAFEYAGSSLNGLFAHRSNLTRLPFWRMLRDVVRFQKHGVRALATLDDETTVESFVRTFRYSEEFVRYFLVPMGSALWSSPGGDFPRFPVRFVIEFFANHGMMQILGRPPWRVIHGGSARYVDALVLATPAEFRVSSPVRSVKRGPGSVDVMHNGGTEPFDHVVFAFHSDEALRLLGDSANPVERDILSQFPYRRNEAVLHTDPSVLPRSRRAWACWNYHLAPDLASSAAVTYNINLLQSLKSPHTFCVSLNEAGIQPSKVIQRIAYHHPMFQPGHSLAQQRQSELIGPNRSSFCGAYGGFGFHEDGVRSALAICRHFGQDLP